MSNSYKVDLSALDEVIKKLNQVVDGMGSPKQKATYDTYLPEGWLGQGFAEERIFREAHAELKQDIEDYISTLEKMIDDFGKKTSKVRTEYDKVEQNTEQAVTSAEIN